MTDDDRRPRILVSNRQPEPLDEAGLVELGRHVLLGEGEGASELSISFVTTEEMADLHASYAGEEGPTDVLSFPLAEADEDGVRILGDVVIAPAVAAANNPTDPAAELRLLLAHGILHLLGYEHEREDDRTEMWARQERYTGVRVP
jgi:probable rRNA maturation factor